MTQTGTGTVRAMKVFRRRVSDLWPKATGAVWYPSDVDFKIPPHTKPPAPPAGILRVQANRSFEEPFAFGGSNSQGRGSMTLVFGVQVRTDMLDAQDSAEDAIRSIGDPIENDDDETIWTLSGIEANPGVAPRGIPESVSTAFSWTQYVIPYQIFEERAVNLAIAIGARFTVGSEVSDSIPVTIQLINGLGVDVTSASRDIELNIQMVLKSNGTIPFADFNMTTTGGISIYDSDAVFVGIQTINGFGSFTVNDLVGGSAETFSIQCQAFYQISGNEPQISLAKPRAVVTFD